MLSDILFWEGKDIHYTSATITSLCEIYCIAGPTGWSCCDSCKVPSGVTWLLFDVYFLSLDWQTNTETKHACLYRLLIVFACSDWFNSRRQHADLQAVADQEVVHFDLKCDNILLEALPGVSEEQFWAPTIDTPPFRVVLADFGDSCDFSLSEQKLTTR